MNQSSDVEVLEYGFLKKTLVLWDLSKRTATNDRLGKLGDLARQRGGAIHRFDGATSRQIPVDGISNLDESGAVIDITAERPLEPDNWVLRLHAARGRGKDGTWDLRLISDHTNASGDRANRGTMVIDQGSGQNWGFLQDVLQVTARGAANSHAELGFNPGGVLSMLLGELGSAERQNVALTLHRNLGSVTDGDKIGALSHVLTFKSKSQASQDVGEDGQENVSVANSGQDDAVQGNADTGVSAQDTGKKKKKGGDQPADEDEVLIRADSGFDFGGGIVGRFVNEPDGAASLGGEGDEKRLVLLFVDSPASPDDKLDTATASECNFDAIKKKVPKNAIHGVVRVPKSDPYKPYTTGDHSSHDESKHDYSYHGTGTGGGGGGGSPQSSGGTYSGDKGLGQGNSGSGAPPADKSNPGGDRGNVQNDGTITKQGDDGFQKIRDPDTGAWNDKLDSNGDKIPNH